MLRIRQNKHVAAAKNYYSAADYYSEGQELTGRWRGEGAKRLGLSGDVMQTQWDALCDNLHPQTGQRLTGRTDADRTIGYDFNFHVPKSVSLLYSLTRDERLLDAFREAVDVTMQDMEAEMATRVRKNGKNEDRQTGNLAWGEFIHFTSRPVTHNGQTKDGEHRLDNGAIFQLRGFDEGGDIILTNGWRIDKDWGHLDHGYVVTSHASQGKTVDRVFIGQSAVSLPASSREQFYVSASRARERVTVYTDDKAALREAIGQTDARLTATEFVNGAVQRQAEADRMQTKLIVEGKVLEHER